MVCGLYYYNQKEEAKSDTLNKKLNDKNFASMKPKNGNPLDLHQMKLHFEGDMKDELPNGIGHLTYKDGSFYTGNVKNGLRHGPGKMVVVQVFDGPLHS